MLILLLQKKVCPENTIYELKDDTGTIEVLGRGKCHNINCNEGDKLKLFCFHLKTTKKQPKLVCGEHSFIQVGSRQWIDLPKRKLTSTLRV